MKLIEEVKTYSSKWMKTKGQIYQKFYWQNGYGGFSVHESQVETITSYILNQEQHHTKKSFKDEYRDFLKEYNIEYDERYVWD